MSIEISVRDRSIAFLISAFLLACYLITYTGVIQSSDGLAMFATTESIVRRGELDANQLLWMDLQQGSYGPDGELYSRKGLGMPLLTLPLVLLAKLWSNIGLVQTALLLNPLLTAWTGAFLFRAGRRLGWTRAAAIFTALTFGLATLAWPYSQTFFSDPVSAWGLFAAFYCLLSFSQTGRKGSLFLAGIFWGLAYLARTINLLTLPIYLLILFVVVRRFILKGFEFTTLQSALRRYWRETASFMIPVIISGVASLWWNWIRYGNVFDSGYLEVESFNGDWIAGIYGLLLSPARGLLWYSPILILSVPGAIWFWQKQRAILLMSLTLMLVYVLTYGKWFMWHGGFSWGPRFLVPALPFLALLIGPVFQWLTVKENGQPRTAMKWIGTITVALLVAVSIGVQWLGMLAPFSLVQNWLADSGLPLFAPETFTQLRYSPLILQQQFITPQSVPFAWWNGGMIRWFGLLMPLIGLVAGLIVLLRQIRAEDINHADETRGVNARTAGDTSRNLLYGSALLMIMLALLTYYYPTLETSEARRLAEQIETFEKPGDVILDLRPSQTQYFANVYHGELPVYGLFAKAELDEVDNLWLTRLQDSYGRLWLLPDGGLPEGSAWERPLRMENFLVWEGRPAGIDHAGEDESRRNKRQRLVLYALTASQRLINNGLGTIFGTPGDIPSEINADNGQIRLSQYAISANVKPGDEMLLALRWESLQPIEQNYHVFVHIMNGADKKVTQRDGQPVQWLRPTSTWQPGEIIVDRYGLLLDEDFESGSYTIKIGLYDPVTQERIPVNAGTGESDIRVGPIHVGS